MTSNSRYIDYPYGMLMPWQRMLAELDVNGQPQYVPAHGSVGNYRYGFQGQEQDDEIKGEGNSINYKFRMHDPRVGRFFAVDPLAGKYPWYTPYQFSGNKVIHAIELEGLEESLLKEGKASNKGTGMLIVITSDQLHDESILISNSTMFDYMLVTDFEKVDMYINQYLSENNLDAIDFLILNGHGTDGFHVLFDYWHDDLEKNERASVWIKPSTIRGQESGIDKKIAGQEMINILSTVKNKGTFVLISCLIHKDFGKACLEMLKNNITILTNSDITTVIPMTGDSYDNGTTVWTEQHVIGGSLTSKDCLLEGWTQTDRENGPQNLGTSIKVSPEGKVLQCEPNEVKSKICEGIND